MGLAARGHAVHLFARGEPFGMPPASGVHVWGLGQRAPSAPDRLDDRWSAQDLETLTATIVTAVGSVGLDVLHFHYAVPFAAVVREVTRRLGARSPRVIGTLHGTDVSVHAARPGTGGELRRALSVLDEITTVSHAHAFLARDTLALPTAPTVIPNFVDTRRFRPRPDDRTSSDPLRIVHVSNFRAVKDPQAAARVFVAVRRHVDAELWLVGDGQEMAATRRLLRRAGVHRHVRLFGLRHDVEGILARADLLLVTSRSESFSLAALEAAASAVPVVATRVGGVPEVVVDGQTGILFDLDDVDAAVRASRRLLTDPALRATMGRAARTRAERFSTERIVPRYEAVYATVSTSPDTLVAAAASPSHEEAAG